MKFTDFYIPGKFVVSFEIFPPKDQSGIEPLFQALTELKVFNPAFVSVTYGAGGSTQGWTKDLAIKIQNELKLNAAFHFTCVGSSREDIKNYVQNLKKEGLNLIVALRGDPPKGDLPKGNLPKGDSPKDKTAFVPHADGFKYASELVTYLKGIDSDFSLAVAGYPEGHVEAVSLSDDLTHLKEKVDAGADVILTQLFFDNKDFFDFVDRARAAGIRVPIIPGILPALNLKQVERMSALSGAKCPSLLRERLAQVEADPDAMRQVGIDHALAQCRELKAMGVPGIHFYILNKAHSTKQILERLL